METESSSKDPGAEGSLAIWVLTLHLLLVSLTSGSPSDRRGAVGEQRGSEHSPGLSAGLGEECISLFGQWPMRFLAFIFDLWGCKVPSQYFSAQSPFLVLQDIQDSLKLRINQEEKGQQPNRKDGQRP